MIPNRKLIVDRLLTRTRGNNFLRKKSKIEIKFFSHGKKLSFELKELHKNKEILNEERKKFSEAAIRLSKERAQLQVKKNERDTNGKN